MPTPSKPGRPQAAAGPERGALYPIFTTPLSAANEFGAENAARQNISSKAKMMVKFLFMMFPPSDNLGLTSGHHCLSPKNQPLVAQLKNPLAFELLSIWLALDIFEGLSLD
jgi:hypothetical protein